MRFISRNDNDGPIWGFGQWRRDADQHWGGDESYTGDAELLSIKSKELPSVGGWQNVHPLLPKLGMHRFHPPSLTPMGSGFRHSSSNHEPHCVKVGSSSIHEITRMIQLKITTRRKCYQYAPTCSKQLKTCTEALTRTPLHAGGKTKERNEDS